METDGRGTIESYFDMKHKLEEAIKAKKHQKSRVKILKNARNRLVKALEYWKEKANQNI